MRKYQTVEDLINEVRTVQKTMRREYLKLVALGFILSNGEVNTAYMAFDEQMIKLTEQLVDLLEVTPGAIIFQSDEGDSSESPSLGGTSSA